MLFDWEGQRWQLKPWTIGHDTLWWEQKAAARLHIYSLTVPNTPYLLVLRYESDCKKSAFLMLGQQFVSDFSLFRCLVEKWPVNRCPHQGKSSSEHTVDGKVPFHEPSVPKNQFISLDGIRQGLSLLRKAESWLVRRNEMGWVRLH